MIFVDTGYLIALINPSDSLHQRALAWAEAIQVQMSLTEYVLLETVNHFSAPLNRLRVHTVLNNIQSSPKWEIIPALPALFQAGLQLHAARPDKEWSLTDCISFVVMKERGISRALA